MPRTAERRRRLAATVAVAVAAAGIAVAPGVVPSVVEAHAPAMQRANISRVLAAIRKPGARAVLVNVWASWCDPCVEEMPEILRFYREHKDVGVRLVLVSADDDDTREQAQKFLARQGVDFVTYQKTGEDMAFINGIEPRWSGALPASVLFDGQGGRQHFWQGSVSYGALSEKVQAILKNTTLNQKNTRRAR